MSLHGNTQDHEEFFSKSSDLSLLKASCSTDKHIEKHEFIAYVKWYCRVASTICIPGGNINETEIKQHSLSNTSWKEGEGRVREGVLVSDAPMVDYVEVLWHLIKQIKPKTPFIIIGKNLTLNK